MQAHSQSSNLKGQSGKNLKEEAVAAKELQELIRVSGNADAVAALSRKAALTQRRRGGTRAALLLEELQVQAQNIPVDNITILLAGIFSIADEIGVDVDKAEAFDVANDLRRTVGSWLAQDGQSLHLIGDVLNRRDPKTTAGYAYLPVWCGHRRSPKSPPGWGCLTWRSQSSVVAPPFQ